MDRTIRYARTGALALTITLAAICLAALPMDPGDRDAGRPASKPPAAAAQPPAGVPTSTAAQPADQPTSRETTAPQTRLAPDASVEDEGQGLSAVMVPPVNDDCETNWTEQGNQQFVFSPLPTSPSQSVSRAGNLASATSWGGLPCPGGGGTSPHHEVWYLAQWPSALQAGVAGALPPYNVVTVSVCPTGNPWPAGALSSVAVLCPGCEYPAVLACSGDDPECGTPPVTSVAGSELTFCAGSEGFLIAVGQHNSSTATPGQFDVTVTYVAEGNDVGCGTQYPTPVCAVGRCCMWAVPEPLCEKRRGVACTACQGCQLNEFLPGEGECPCLGACCDDGGGCELIRNYNDCEEEFQGWDTTCPCPLGACCHGDGSCTEMKATDCNGAGDRYVGHATECDSLICNDVCDHAIAINSITPVPFAATVSNENSSEDAGFDATCAVGSGGDVWYRYDAPGVPPASQTVRVHTCGSFAASGADTAIAVYKSANPPADCPLDAAEEIACDDDCSMYEDDPDVSCRPTDPEIGYTLDACACFEAEAGFTYFIRVLGVSGDVGDINLEVSSGSCDALATGACCRTVDGTDVCTDSVTSALCGSEGGTWTEATACANLVTPCVNGAGGVCCQWNSASPCDGSKNHAQCDASANHCWVNGGGCGACPASATEPANNECPAAVLIQSPYNPVQASTVLACNGSINDAEYCDTAVPYSPLWYRVQGTGNTLTVTTCSEDTNFDTKVQIFCGGCGDLTCVTGNDDDLGAYSSACDTLGVGANHGSTVSWCSAAGTDYYVLVGGFRDAVGTVKVQVSQGAVCPGAPCESGACCANDSCTQQVQSDCDDAGEVFLGVGAPCSAGLCDLGACCIGSSTCNPNVIRAQCSGTWFDGGCLPGPLCPCGNGTISGGEQCDPPGEYPGGAVCNEDCKWACGDHVVSAPETCDPPEEGVCSETCQALAATCPKDPAEAACCVAHEGLGCSTEGCCDDVCQQDSYCCQVEWDAACAQRAVAICDACQGACCADGGCTSTTRSVCVEDLGGNYFGEGTHCNDDPAPCATGACCRTEALGVVTCYDGIAPGACAGSSDSYSGPGSRCATVACHPVHDSCAGAKSVSLGTAYVGSLEDSTPDVVEFCDVPAPTDTVWYKVVGNGSRFRASTCGSTSSTVDTRLQVYCNTCDSLACVGGGDDSGAVCANNPAAAEVIWCATNLQTYYIAVGRGEGASNAAGFELTVTDLGACGEIDPVSCTPPTGACCTPGEICTNGRTFNQCHALGGSYNGEGSLCSGVVCEDPPANDRCAMAHTSLVDLSSTPPPSPAPTRSIDLSLATSALWDPPFSCHWTGRPSRGWYTVWYAIKPPAEPAGSSGRKIRISASGDGVPLDLVAALYLAPKVVSNPEGVLQYLACDTLVELDCAEDQAEPGTTAGEAVLCYNWPDDTDLSDRLLYVQVAISPGAGVAPGPVEIVFDASQGCGACCLPVGDACDEIDPNRCAAQQGSFLSFATLCTPSQPCDTGACCAAGGTTCSPTTPGNCSGIFYGVGSACGDYGCPMVNDRCEYAVALDAAGDEAVVDTSWASVSSTDSTFSCRGDSPSDGFGTVWYRFCLDDPGDIHVSTCGTQRDTVLAVYRAYEQPSSCQAAISPTACHGLLEMGCSDDACGSGSDVCLTDLPEGLYFVQLATWSPDDRGEFKLLVSDDCSAPTNDECDGPATAIGEGTHSFSTVGASTDDVVHVDSDCDPEGVGPRPRVAPTKDVWFDYTYSGCCAGDMVRFSTCDAATFDTQIVVYDDCDEGTACEDLNLLGCNDDTSACSGFTSALEIELSPNQCRKVRVGGFEADDAGSGVLKIECAAETPPTPTSGNDVCVGGTNPCSKHADCAGGACHLKNRFLSITPAVTEDPYVIQVKPTSLPASFSAFVDDIWYAAAPVPRNEGPPGGTFMAAALQCGSAGDWDQEGLVHLYGEIIVPGGTYEVRACAGTCAPCSDPLTVQTAKFGDVVSPPQTADFLDINAVVDKFRGLQGSVSKTRAKMQPRVVNPDSNIGFLDISDAVSAFQGHPYPYLGGECP